MKKISVILSIITFLLFSCKEKTEFYKIAGETQGTTYSIIYEGNNPDIKKSIDSILHAFDMSLSTYEPNSVIQK